MAQGWVRQIAVLTLGVLFPLLILVQAYSSMASISRSVARGLEPADMVAVFKQVQPQARTPNDYALFSQIFAEDINRTVITNKQVIKVAIVQIGFAAMSLGLMFVILGINDGGGEGKLKWLDLDLDFKTASTGALVFVVGALMATAGGVLKNEYRSIPLPNYIGGGGGGSEAEAKSLLAYEKCKALGDEFERCFTQIYGQINEGALQP